MGYNFLKIIKLLLFSFLLFILKLSFIIFVEIKTIILPPAISFFNNLEKAEPGGILFMGGKCYEKK
jgi:hypothetical protein